MATLVRMWSGPRNISTALMRSWENRTDTAVIDEPLYAHFLSRTGVDHPGRAEILRAGPTILSDAIDRCIAPVLESGQTVSYQKHMAHHLLPDMDLDWIANAVNFVLVRHPNRVIASYAKVRNHPTLTDLGYPQLLELQRRFGPLPVIEADKFLSDPEVGLRAMCQHVGVEFDPNMLRWPPGPRSSDGVWSPYWYKTVRSSTAFSSAPDGVPPDIEVPEHLDAIARRAVDLYDALIEG